MKKVYLIILLIAVTFNTVFSQVPNAFNYQAVVRSSTGQILANQAVSFRISLLKNSETGTVVYSETHALTTNEFGLVNFKIGEGTILSGSFSSANWGEVIFIKVEFDPDGGSSYSHLATTKLSSVPYAFKAQTVVDDQVDDADADPANEIQTLSLSGNDLTIEGGNTVTLPESDSPWQNFYSGGGIYYSDGQIGIGTNVKTENILFDVSGGDRTAISTINNSASNATLVSRNLGTGPAAYFHGSVKINDGTQGNGKVLTSDADGVASWQTAASGGSSLWTANGSNIYRSGGFVGIGTSSPIHSIDIHSNYAMINLKAISKHAGVILDRNSSSDLAYLLLRTDGDNKYYVGLLGTDTYRINYGGTSDLTGLEVKTTGDVAMSNDLKVAGEVHSENTGNANMIPIAYGTIKEDGTIYKSSGNISVSKTATGTYHITITGESYIFYNYITTATLTNNGFITTGSVSGKLIIKTSDTSGNPKNMVFSFVVYKP